MWLEQKNIFPDINLIFEDFLKIELKYRLILVNLTIVYFLVSWAHHPYKIHFLTALIILKAQTGEIIWWKRFLVRFLANFC